MRRSPPPSASAAPETARRGDWQTVARLLPYFWRYRWRVGLALGFMLRTKRSPLWPIAIGAVVGAVGWA